MQEDADAPGATGLPQEEYNSQVRQAMEFGRNAKPMQVNALAEEQDIGRPCVPSDLGPPESTSESKQSQTRGDTTHGQGPSRSVSMRSTCAYRLLGVWHCCAICRVHMHIRVQLHEHICQVFLQNSTVTANDP